MKNNSSPEKILLVRNDRIGDLVLATPAIEILRAQLPGARIDLLCSAYAAPVLQGNPNLDRVLTDKGAHDSSDLGRTAAILRAGGYTCAVVMVHSLKNARLVRKARIPLRIGPLVKWYAPLFFNRTVRQKRSRAEKNEARYNVELLAPLGVSVEDLPHPAVKPTGEALERAREYIDTEFGGFDPGPLVLVHSGMGGSALNWPQEHYVGLIRGLVEGDSGVRILLTGSEKEQDLLERLSGGLGGHKPVRVSKKMSLEDLIGLIARSNALVAPSTGPLHIAAALGVPLAGIYSPVRVHHPTRWGPLGPGKIKVFLPRAECPGVYDCLEERCPHWPCMTTIGPAEVLEYIQSVLE